MSTFQPSKSQVLTVRPISADSEKSVARINLCGTNQRVINHLSETTYEVISGKGTMEVNGEFINLEPGVKVTVPAEVPYQDWGTVEMKATSTPPFDIKFVEVLP